MQNTTLALVALACIIGACTAETCFDVTRSCELDDYQFSSCKTAFGRFPSLNKDMQTLTQEHLKASVQLMLMGSHFDEWRINRKGFHDYFMKLSDSNWEQGIELLKYNTVRGGELTSDFSIAVPNDSKDMYRMYEVPALAKALDMEKHMATDTLHVAHKASLHTTTTHKNGTITHNSDFDGALSNFLEESVNKNKVPSINGLSSHINNLATAMRSSSANDPAFILFLYDTTFIQ